MNERISSNLIIAGWVVPVIVVGWFKFAYRPVGENDNAWAFAALVSVAAAFVIGWLLLLTGTAGVMKVPVKQMYERVLIGFGVVGLCLYTLVLFGGAILFAPM